MKLKKQIYKFIIRSHRKFRWRLGYYQWTLFLLKADSQLRSFIVSGDTDLMIEGFPRSANTFSRLAFIEAQHRPVHVASHLHLIGHCRKAFRMKIPCLLLIRKPIDAVASLLIFDGVCISASQALLEYIEFYNKLMPYRKAYVVAKFEDVITDYGLVIKRINDKFGVDFDLFEHHPENVEKCFADIDFCAKKSTHKEDIINITGRPTPSTKSRKAEIIQILLSDEYRDLYSEAERVYRTWISDEFLDAN